MIYLNGACGAIPAALPEQISIGGRLVAMTCPAGRRMGEAVLIRRDGEAAFSDKKLFEAGVSYLPGLAPEKAFAF